MKKLLIFFALILNAYPTCSMCHNGRVAPNLDSMSKKEILKKLLAMKKNPSINPKMAFIKSYSDEEIKKMVNQLKRR